MDSRRSKIHFSSTELDETFRFDSRIPYNPSKSKSKQEDMILDFSQRTSEIVRYAQENNDNILELLEESGSESKTHKGEKEERKQLWDFFARFEKQSNPDITISQIEAPVKKRASPRKIIPKRKKSKQKQSEEYNQKKQSESNGHSFGVSEICFEEIENSRYPRRNRISPLKFWLGERVLYRKGKMVNIKKIEEERMSL